MEKKFKKMTKKRKQKICKYFAGTKIKNGFGMMFESIGGTEKQITIIRKDHGVIEIWTKEYVKNVIEPFMCTVEFFQGVEREVFRQEIENAILFGERTTDLDCGISQFLN